VAKEKDAFVVFWKYFSRILIVLSIATALFIGFMIFALFYRGSTKPILAVADKFKPDSSWRLTQESIEPPMVLCIGDLPCPNASRTWERDRPATKDELLSYLPGDWLRDAEASIDCSMDNQALSCDIALTEKGYSISIGSYASTGLTRSFIIGIDVKRA
jgi:hypothetical protein